MKQNLLVLITVLTLTACHPTTTNSTSKFILPTDLDHCKIIELESSDFSTNRIFLIKCPPGTTPDGYIGTSVKHSVGKHLRRNTTMFLE